ncbi:hypothetical protein ACFODL_09855 [Phenylobacterium terrae]|uniref:Transcriptional regulator n=1 Tax=Phenylobacterium terrae TaxID=2665495 RepID=A0ABW4N599_9CAUL
MISFDPSILMNYYQSRLGVTGQGGASELLPRKKYAPTAPWSPGGGAPDPAQSVRNALLGRRFIDEGAAKLDLAGASADYRRMFALYNGLSTLMGVAERMNAKGLTSVDQAKIRSTFTKGMAEIANYVDDLKLDSVRLTRGEAMTRARMETGVPRDKTEYITAPLVSGSSSAEVPAFQGDVKFDISLKRVNDTLNVSIDLSQMGSTPRTMGNVVGFINQKLADAGAVTRFASHRIPGAERTTTVNGRVVKLTPEPDRWALKVKTDIAEKLTFSAPATAGAVYMAQTVGNPDPDGKPSTDDAKLTNQFLKFQTDVTSVPAPLQTSGEANFVDGRAFAKDLDPNVIAVRATQVGPDGAVYMLADVENKVAGQEIKGTQDVALLKYDSAGNLLYTRTLGASDKASGLALAVSADGKVAVAGSVTGAMNGTTNGVFNSGETGAFADQSDSFVTLFDADGQEMWTQRRGARQADEASQVSFGADGAVYVAGRARSSITGSTGLGGWDNYIQGFKADATGKVQHLFTQAVGSSGDDRAGGLVVDGDSLVVAGVENGRAVLRRFDLQATGAPTLVATRDLGEMQGEIKGLVLDGGQLVLAGTTRNAALSAGTITQAHAGGSDAFVARLSANLTPAASDRLAYYGGTGDEKLTGLAAKDGQIWLSGQAGADLPDQPKVGTKDGFLARIDVDTGDAVWSRRFTGREGHTAPGPIAIDTTGASVLDRIGLPKGTLDLSDSPRVTAVSAARAGDTFYLRADGGRPQAVTLDEKDTLETLATKIRRALAFRAKVEIVTSEGVRRLQIKPLHDRSLIEILPGKGSDNALEVLGLAEGVVRNTKVVDGKTVPADGKAPLYGLGLPSDLNLDDIHQVRHALAEISSAMSVIRTAYKDLVALASPKPPPSTVNPAGHVPAYLQSQIANYQSALDRLTGGG